MSTFEYTDRYSNPFRIATSENHEGHVCLTMLDSNPTRWFPADDAPATALAILDAAGVEPIDPDIPGASAAPDSLALYWLYQWQGLRKANAERAAEDAKVRAWLRIEYDYLKETEDNEISVTDAERNLYRRHLDFFTALIDGTDYHAEAEKPAPRVLNYGDPEPDRDTRWEGSDGCQWSWNADLGDWDNFDPDGDYVFRNRWRVIHPDNFPMTEVL